MDEKTRRGVWDDDAWQAHLDSLNEADAKKEEEEKAAAAKSEEPPAAESGEAETKEPAAEAETPPEAEAETAEKAETEPEAEPEAETPPADAPAPLPLEVKFRGAQRSFDLANEEEKKQVVSLVSKGLDYEALVKERDEHVARDATKMRDDYFRETGILALDQSDAQWKPDPAGIVRWASAVLGPERFREAASAVLGAAPAAAAGGMDLKEIDALEAEAAKYPEDPVYDPIRKMAGALKAQARVIQGLQSGVDSRIKQFEGRFAGMDEAQKRVAQAEYQQSMLTHRDAEIAKVAGLALDDEEKQDLIGRAARLEQAAIQQGRKWSPELSKECITAAVKAFAAKRVASAAQQQSVKKKATIEARPKPKTPAPSSSAPKPAPPKGDEISPRQKRADMWKDFSAAMAGSKE